MSHWRNEVALALFAPILAISPSAWAAQESIAAGKTYEMEVMGVQPDPVSGTPLVFLRGKQDKRELSMFIGFEEAKGIILPLQGMRLPRPYTHDLMLETIHRLKAKVKRVIITELRENTYYASLILDAEGQEVILDSRPSDAIALALRENAPILATEKVFLRHGQAGQPEAGKP